MAYANFGKCKTKGCSNRAAPGKAYCSPGCSLDSRRRRHHDGSGQERSSMPLSRTYAPGTPIEIEGEFRAMSYAELNSSWVARIVEAVDDGAGIRELAAALVAVRDRYRGRLGEASELECKRVG